MNQRVLLVVSVLLALAGTAVLLFLQPEVSPQQLQLSGKVTEVSNREKVTFLTFVPDDLLVVSFEGRAFVPGEYVLTGRLQQYKGRVEFVVESEEKVEQVRVDEDEE